MSSLTMHFSNDSTRSITSKDKQLLRHVSFMMRSFFLITVRKRIENKDWNIHFVDCHSISRLISKLITDCTLIDGYLIGMKFQGNTVRLIDTCHSWIRTPDGAIIDPYPMGVISPSSVLLIPTTENIYTAHGAEMYREDRGVQKHFDVANSWRRAYSHLRILRKNFDDQINNEVVEYITEL